MKSLGDVMHMQRSDYHDYMFQMTIKQEVDDEAFTKPDYQKNANNKISFDFDNTSANTI